MQYVNLGRAGLSVSRICLGCMSYGSLAWRPWILDEAAARPLFRAARDAGINFFDTADNLLYREEERETMPLCRAEGLGVLPWSPLARGLLAVHSGTAREKSDTYTELLYGQPGEADIIDAVRRVAEARGVSPAEVALAWLLSKDGVTAPIVGATKLAHLEAAVRAVDLRLTDDERKTLEAPYRPREVRGH
jgi:aryl-alcohol dehydrogenase-like predicted oxidoreductase